VQLSIHELSRLDSHRRPHRFSDLQLVYDRRAACLGCGDQGRSEVISSYAEGLQRFLGVCCDRAVNTTHHTKGHLAGLTHHLLLRDGDAKYCPPCEMEWLGLSFKVSAIFATQRSWHHGCFNKISVLASSTDAAARRAARVLRPLAPAKKQRAAGTGTDGASFSS
jgi:hypothetical protein